MNICCLFRRDLPQTSLPVLLAPSLLENFSAVNSFRLRDSIDVRRLSGASPRQSLCSPRPRGRVRFSGQVDSETFRCLQGRPHWVTWFLLIFANLASCLSPRLPSRVGQASDLAGLRCDVIRPVSDGLKRVLRDHRYPHGVPFPGEPMSAILRSVRLTPARVRSNTLLSIE